MAGDLLVPFIFFLVFFLFSFFFFFENLKKNGEFLKILFFEKYKKMEIFFFKKFFFLNFNKFFLFFFEMEKFLKNIDNPNDKDLVFKWFEEIFPDLKEDSEEEQIKDLHLFIKDFYIRKDALVKFREGRNIFITGGAGTGKTHLFNELMNSTEKSILKTSTTAVSAINFSGKTIDSALLPILITKNTFYCKKTYRFIEFKEAVTKMCERVLNLINSNYYEDNVNKISDADIIGIEEVSMLSKFKMDFYSECLKTIRINDNPFGGLQVLLSGDFFQLKPIETIIEENVIESTKQYAFESNAWKELNLFWVNLEYGHRQKDKEYMGILNRIRIGSPSSSDISYLTKRVNKIIQDDTIKIYPINSKVNEENQRCLAKLTTENIEFNMKIFRTGVLSKEFITNAIKESKLPSTIILKVGCKIMVTRNVKVEEGICNGVTGIFKGRSSKSKNEILIEIPSGEIKYVPLVSYKKFESIGNYITIEQFPVELAFAISGHKSQGSTIKGKVTVDCGNSIFSTSQTYVMLSRVERGENVNIINFNPSKIMVDKKVRIFYGLEDEDVSDKKIDIKDFNKSFLRWERDIKLIIEKGRGNASINSNNNIPVKKSKTEKE